MEEIILAAIGAELRDLNETMLEIADHLEDIGDALNKNAPSSATNTEQGNETR